MIGEKHPEGNFKFGNFRFQIRRGNSKSKVKGAGRKPAVRKAKATATAKAKEPAGMPAVRRSEGNG
jgi:hypothetical protein